MASSRSGGSGSFSPLGPSRGGPTHIFLFYSMLALFHLGNSTISGALGVECLQPSLDFQVSYVFPPPALVPLVLSKFLAEDGSHVTSLFWGNSRQHLPVCAKTISSWVRKVLCVAKAHMSLGSLWEVAASLALAAGVSLVTILQAGDWARVSTPARHYFSTCITTTDQHQDSVQHAVLGLSE